MSSNETKQKTEELCICRQCPSFVNCKEEITFCLMETGKSNCIKKENGCICGGCPIEKKFDFMHGYYCTRGSEKEQL